MDLDGSSGLQVAVLGTGSIGMRHLRVLRGLGARPVAVPARAGRAEALRAEGWEVASSLEEARSLGAGAAVVATDTGRHASDALRALDLGMVTLCEKPLATCRAEGLPLLARTESLGVPVLVAQCLRFDEGMNRFRELLPAVGDVHSVRVECRSYLPSWRPSRNYRECYSARPGEGGVLLDLVHDVDYALWLFGVPRSVWGTVQNTGRLSIRSEEMAEAFWRAPGARSVSVALDYLSRSPVRVLRASGAEGNLSYDFIGRRLALGRPGTPEEVIPVPGEPQDMYPRQAEAFLRLVAGGGAAGLATLEEALRALAVCDAWRRSAVSGRAEEVAP